MGYFINPQPAKLAVAEPDPASAADLARWRAQLENGPAPERRAALRRLVDARAEDVLAQCLSSADPAVVQHAVDGLWECWLGEAGEGPRREIEAGTAAMNNGNLAEASLTFSQLVERYPDWAEPLNKLATVLYLQGKSEASSGLCRQVVALKPDHFGAWNGLALCAIQTGNWSLARRAVQESLRLQPHSPTNLQLLQLVQSRLSQA